MSAQGPVERLGVIAHELRSPVAALAALAAAGRSVPPSDRPRLVSLAVAAARDIERILSDPELISLRLEAIDVGALADGLRTDAVTVAVDRSTARGRRSGRDCARSSRTSRRTACGTARPSWSKWGSGTAWSSSTSSTTARGWRPGVDVFARGSSGAGSSGLGLWLSRAIAEAHGGTLDLVPEPGPGARFRLSLPSASAAG